MLKQAEWVTICSLESTWRQLGRGGAVSAAPAAAAAATLPPLLAWRTQLLPRIVALQSVRTRNTIRPVNEVQTEQLHVCLTPRAHPSSCARAGTAMPSSSATNNEPTIAEA